MICLVNKTPQSISSETVHIQHSIWRGMITIIVFMEWIGLGYSVIIAGANLKGKCGSSSVTSDKLFSLYFYQSRKLDS